MTKIKIYSDVFNIKHRTRGMISAFVVRVEDNPDINLLSLARKEIEVDGIRYFVEIIGSPGQHDPTPWDKSLNFECKKL